MKIEQNWPHSALILMSSTVTYSLGIFVLSLRNTWVVWILTSHFQCVYKVSTLQNLYIVLILFLDGVCPKWLWTQNAFTCGRNPPSLFDKPLERWWISRERTSLFKCPSFEELKVGLSVHKSKCPGCHFRYCKSMQFPLMDLWVL